MRFVKKFTEWWSDHPVYRWLEARINNHFRKKLQNDNFTILCSNCIGGLIYHRLGKQFLTPTQGTYITQTDFVSFCIHLNHYLQQPLEFFTPEAPHRFAARLAGDGREVPTITVNFPHCSSVEEANTGWERRKKRINLDNLYIILYNLDGITPEQLRMLEQVPCRNKVVLTAHPLPEISWSHYIKPVKWHQNSYTYMNRDLLGFRYYEKKFDFVGFLNQ